MSRCYPFPPPGYVRNGPAELELPSKKEKRKHKDKKKKRKKHSATNGDLILQEDRSLEEIQQSGLASEGFRVGSERLPETKCVLSAAPNQGAIQRLQNDNLRDKASSNCVLATNAERPEQRPQLDRLKDEGLSNGAQECVLEQRPQLHKLKNEGLPNGVLAGNSERSQVDRSRERMLSNGGLATDNKRSKQSMQMVDSTSGVLTNGMLATQSKRLKADNPREKLLPNGLAATSFKRPEQGLQAGNLGNEVFSNGVLSTKRKRLQADNHGDKLLPSAVLANDCKRSQQGLQAGNSKYELSSDGVQGTSNMRSQADRSSLSNAITPERSEQRLRADRSSLSSAITPERSEQRLRADNSGIKAIRDGVQATSIQAGNVNSKEFSQHSWAANSRLQADKLRHEVMSNGMLTTERQKLQADNFRVKMPSNDVLASRCGRSEKNLQAGNKVVSNGVRDTNITSLQAVNPSEKVFSGAVRTSNCKSSDQTLKGETLTKEAFPTASTKRLQAGSVKPEAISHGARATSCEGFEQRLQAGNSRHEAQANGVLDAGRLQADKSRTKMLSHGVVAASCDKCDPRLQDQFKKEVMSNGGLLASKCDEFNADGKINSHLPSLTAGATVGGDGEAPKDVTPGSRVNLESDDELIRLCRHLARPHTEQIAEDEDWLISSNKQLQPKPGDSQIPQVWEEAVLLPLVGINALPYVVPN